MRIKLCLQLDWRAEYINSVGTKWAFKNQGQVWDRGRVPRDRDRPSTAPATCPLIVNDKFIIKCVCVGVYIGEDIKQKKQLSMVIEEGKQEEDNSERKDEEE